MNKKKILITGKGSYVGTSFINWVKQWPDQYEVEELSVRGEAWKEHDFSQYNAILHVAAVVHQKEKPENQQLYDDVNKNLVISIANKAKQDGVEQFIFMSSMSVYGIEGVIGKDIVINEHTKCKPTSFYGKSKLAAEETLMKMNSKDLKIAVIRAPMIYGQNCPGNYTRLRSLALKLPVFPLILNKRSMIYIDNLSEFIKWLLISGNNGVFFPQNKEYISTDELVRLISSANNKKIIFLRVMATPIKMLGNKFNVMKKLFGNLQYDLTMSLHGEYDYCLADLEYSIQKSEIDGA